MIELTLLDGRSLYVAPHAIATFARWKESQYAGSALTVIGDPEPYGVRETPEEIVALAAKGE